MKDGIYNAIVEKVFIGIGAQGIPVISLTFYIENGFHQSFGNYSLGRINNWNKEPNVGMISIVKISEILGAEDIANSEGHPLRIKEENGRIKAIGHFLNDKWFCPEDFFKDID